MGMRNKTGGNHTNDIPENNAVVPSVSGMKYSSLPVQGEASFVAIDKTDPKANGDQPTFGLPPFADGRDLRNGR